MQYEACKFFLFEDNVVRPSSVMIKYDYVVVELQYEACNFFPLKIILHLLAVS